MASPQFNDFCAQVCLMIRWKAAREPVADELTAHLEDHAAALEARGLDPETAARRAVEAMGDPYALGAELDAAHPPTLPRLSRVLLALGLLILLAGFGLGANQHTGLFAMAGVFPQAPELPCDEEDTVVLEGTASGGGVLGGYTLAPSGRAGLVYVRWEYEGDVEEQYQLQAPLTAAASRPWLPVPAVYAPDAVYTDDAGGSGSCYLTSGEDYLLGSTAWLLIVNPTPGATEFSITVSAATGEAIFFTVTLPEEVPPL